MNPRLTTTAIEQGKRLHQTIELICVGGPVPFYWYSADPIRSVEYLEKRQAEVERAIHEMRESWARWPVRTTQRPFDNVVQ